MTDEQQTCPGVWVDNVHCSCEGGHGELTELQQKMLDLESQRFVMLGSKANAIHDLMGPGNWNRYYQLLAALIDREIALAHNPSLVKRLRRIRDSKPWERRGVA